MVSKAGVLLRLSGHFCSSYVTSPAGPKKVSHHVQASIKSLLALHLSIPSWSKQVTWSRLASLWEKTAQGVDARDRIHQGPLLSQSIKSVL